MAYEFGLAKTGGAGANDWAYSTDLGIQQNFQTGSFRVAKSPAKGAIATIDTIVTGRGYPLGPNGIPKEGILCSATGGSGTGAQFMVRSIAATGSLIIDSVVQPTANFQNYQTRLFDALDVSTSNFTYARVNAGNLPLTAVSTAVAGTSTTGTSGAFIVTVNFGSVTNVSVSGAGTGFVVGDTVTITKAALEANLTGNTFQGDLELLLTKENVSGGLDTGVASVEVINGGEGYTVGNTLTLQVIGSTLTGTGTLDVATLDTSTRVNTQPNNIYPRGVSVGEVSYPAGTGTDIPKTIKFVGLDDVEVIIGGFCTGKIYPIRFKQIIDNGSDITLGTTTIYY